MIDNLQRLLGFKRKQTNTISKEEVIAKIHASQELKEAYCAQCEIEDDIFAFYNYNRKVS